MTKIIDLTRYWSSISFAEASLLADLKIAKENFDSLCHIGLPNWVAPNMHFYYELPTIVENLYVIGEDRNDRYIYLLEGRPEVVVLEKNSEEGFVYMNSDVFTLIKTLILYWEMIEDSIAKCGPDCEVLNQLPQDAISNFKLKLSEIDELATKKGSFWAEEIHRRVGHEID